MQLSKKPEQPVCSLLGTPSYPWGVPHDSAAAFVTTPPYKGTFAQTISCHELTSLAYLATHKIAQNCSPFAPACCVNLHASPARCPLSAGGIQTWNEWGGSSCLADQERFQNEARWHQYSHNIFVWTVVLPPPLRALVQLSRVLTGFYSTNGKPAIKSPSCRRGH